MEAISYTRSSESQILSSNRVGISRLATIASPSDAYIGKKQMGTLIREAAFNAGFSENEPSEMFSGLIKPGSVVLLKPNWVFHENHSGSGMDCLTTHASVLGAVLDLILQANPAKVIVGDAPIQGCDLNQLMLNAGYSALKKNHEEMGSPIEWRDFRRTTLENTEGIWRRKTGLHPLSDYILFDLGGDSLLEPISQKAERFRVTMYNPEFMRKTHAFGRHQYLIARDVIEADVVINMPKLKTHKKACITGALKNLVGINGSKDNLPHHRLGGSRAGGDCYEGDNPFKYAAEHLRDAANRRSGVLSYLLRQSVRFALGLAKLNGADSNLEGNWYGNDTVWRMCLDLNRIALYGNGDGTMSDIAQRKMLCITDAIVCGEGEGPLAPEPHVLGMITVSNNPVAADYVHADLMGFDWQKIPLIREAFGDFTYPLCHFQPKDVEVKFEGHLFHQPWPLWNDQSFVPPAGWLRHCER